MKIESSAYRPLILDDGRPGAPVKQADAAASTSPDARLQALVAAENRLASLDLPETGGNIDVVDHILGESGHFGLARTFVNLSIRV